MGEKGYFFTIFPREGRPRDLIALLYFYSPPIPGHFIVNMGHDFFCCSWSFCFVFCVRFVHLFLFCCYCLSVWGFFWHFKGSLTSMSQWGKKLLASWQNFSDPVEDQQRSIYSTAFFKKNKNKISHNFYISCKDTRYWIPQKPRWILRYFLIQVILWSY